ncbi:single-stranded DNA-binding protein [Patescibacteria group bacterium]|nr:single-stranded DNA-binding protein [Patescibacteria group bacterium]MBU4453109.1 single-stranded DNA-binding protein [Patescibacteria group bacterium]MCG2687291.1 single-stranded DNA-binding protein [Candidatus Parcubacteria bacterium]
MSASLNKAMVIGNLTRDPELRQTGSGQAVCSFGVATNRTWKDASGEKQEQTEFHNIVAWGKLAEIINQYLKKGNKIFVEGRLQTRDWEGQDGVKRYRTEIVAENMVMLGGKGDSTSFGSGPDASAPIINVPSANDEIKLEDIPF